MVASSYSLLFFKLLTAAMVCKLQGGCFCSGLESIFRGMALFESRQGQCRIAIDKGHFKWMEICKLQPDGSWLPVYRTEGAPGRRTCTDPIFLEQVMQDMGESILT